MAWRVFDGAKPLRTLEKGTIWEKAWLDEPMGNPIWLQFHSFHFCKNIYLFTHFPKMKKVKKHYTDSRPIRSYTELCYTEAKEPARKITQLVTGSVNNLCWAHVALFLLT